VAVPCKWPSPGVLGWIGLLEACARCKDVASAKQTLNDAAAALGLVGSSSDSSTTSTTDDGEEGVDESFKATLTAISKAEPLLLGAASAVFANGEGYGNPGPALLAATQAALEANGDEVVSFAFTCRPLQRTSCCISSFISFQFRVYYRKRYFSFKASVV